MITTLDTNDNDDSVCFFSKDSPLLRYILSIIMAIPSENPIVAANLPPVLDRPQGTNTSAEALRNAPLGVAASHISH